MANRKRRGERADGLIQVTLDVGYDANGKRIRKSFYGKSRSEAERKRDEYRNGMIHNSKITVGEWVKICKDTYRQNVDEAYLGNDDVPYNRLVDELGYKPVAAVTEIDLQKALNKVSGMSFSTVNKYKYCIIKVFEKARRNKIISDNPADDLIMPPYTKGTHRALEMWEIDLILKYWNASRLYAGLWVMIMMFSGLRRGELMALEWSSVDMMNRLLTVCQTAVVKGNQTKIVQRAKTDAGLRTIPICQQLYDALNSVPEGKRKGFVCLSAHGKQLSESAFSRGLEAFCTAIERVLNGEPMFQNGKRNDIVKPTINNDRIKFSFRAHDLRHTFATLLYNFGTDVKTAQYWLGHSDTKMTLDLYTHLTKEKEMESALALNKNFCSIIPNSLSQTDVFVGKGGNLVVCSDIQNAEIH